MIELSPEGPIIVITDSVNDIKMCTRCTGNGSIPTVSDPAVYIASVEALKLQSHFE